jgi:two-component sensor histidine kinase
MILGYLDTALPVSRYPGNDMSLYGCIMKLTDQLLRNYDGSDFIIRLKVRFLLYLCIAVLAIIPFSTSYALYVQINNAAFDRSVNGPTVIGLAVIGALMFLIMLGMTALLLRGHYLLTSHAVIVLLFASIWAVMFLDRADALSRLDTVVLIMSILSAAPIFAFTKKYHILPYATVNLGILYAFLFLLRDTFAVPEIAFYDYLSDTTLGFVFITIAAYNIVSINGRALGKSEESGAALQRANQELQAAMEELTAANEELEAQNEELVHSEEVIRESLAEKTVLVKEVHHRVKNNMQVISSLLNLQAGAVGEPAADQALRDAVGRIRSMARIHERIYGTGDFTGVDMSAYITELARDIAALHSGVSKAIRFNARTKPVFMDIDRAVPCGLLMNEILSNSIKHGCGESGDYTVDINVDESDGFITLVVADRGPGMDAGLYAAEEKSSMGMQIIDALARQIGATVDLEVAGGTRFTVRVPSEGRRKGRG